MKLKSGYLTHPARTRGRGSFLVFLLILGVETCLPRLAMGQTGSPRDRIIAQELDCVSQHLREAEELSWQDVCYSPEKIKRERVSRDAIMDRALEKAAEEFALEQEIPPPPGKRSRKVILDEKGRVVPQEGTASFFDRKEGQRPVYKSFDEIAFALEEGKMGKKDKTVTVTGEIKMGVGITPRELLWKRANYDLNERNFRMTSEDQLNNKENAFDPAIYDSLKFDIDAKKPGVPFSFHSNVSIDPWSFTAKSKKLTVDGTGGDRVEVELLYWENTGYTVNQIFYTLDNGDAMSFPELKKTGNHTLPTTVTSKFNNTFDFPEIKLERQFQPIRELWVDYVPGEKFRVKFFPMAYQDMALTSDDPLHLSNNHIYWEESQWLVNWKPGNFNSGATPGDFTKGKWDDSLAFFTRDSEGVRLTALRGLSLDMNPWEGTSLKVVIATPKDLWQEYDRFKSVPASLRVKSFLTDNFYLGGITNAHLGFAEDELDATNYVGGIDGGMSFSNGLKLEAQVSASWDKQDMTNKIYATEKRGSAYYVALSGASSLDEDILKKDYFGLHPKNQGEGFLKGKIYYAHMDEGFESSLASYRKTRDDMFWSRHIHFRTQFNKFFAGEKKGLSWQDIEPFGIGNGIDIGRYVVGLRMNAATPFGRLKNETSIRNVHATSHKFIENVARTEFEYQATDRLNTKMFLLRHALPKTKGGVDPFIFDSASGDFFTNVFIPDGEDPSLWTGSLGARYELTERIKIHGIWEYTNDFTAAADNFPRALLSDLSFTTFTENGLTFRKELPFLYTQGAFDLPPYEPHHIFKAGLEFRPLEKLDIYLDYTRNPNEYAGKIDNNMNHIGLEMDYRPTTRLGMFFKYTFSRSHDIFRLINGGETILESHHNVFTEINYKISPTERLILQYGVGMSPSVSSLTFDPNGGSLSTLDTQHIFRLRYQKVF